MTVNNSDSSSLFRLRFGIILILLSWIPFAQMLIYIAHNNDKLTSEGSANTFRLAIWGIQILVGLIGLWLAGKVAISAAKEDGWQQTPKHLWQLFWSRRQTTN